MRKNNQGKRSILMFSLVATLVLMTLVLASYYRNQYNWNDDFEDGVVNHTLWTNYTAIGGDGGAATGVATVQEITGSGGYYYIYGEAQGDGNTGRGLAVARTATDYKTGLSYIFFFTANGTLSASQIRQIEFNQGNTLSETAAGTNNPTGTISVANLPTTATQTDYYLILTASGNATIGYLSNHTLINSVDVSSLTNYFVQFRGSAASVGSAFGIWQVFNFTSGDYGVVLNAPTNGTLTASSPISFNATMFFEGNITNATIYIWNSTGSLINSSSSSSSGMFNTAQFNLSVPSTGTYNWNIIACYNNSITACGSAPNNNSFFYGISAGTNIYNATTYETAQEAYYTNLTMFNTSAVTNTSLYWNGTYKPGAIVSLGSNNYALTSVIDIPKDPGFKNWGWNLVFADGSIQNTTTTTQNVSWINLTLCRSAPQNVSYLNFTFKNETTGTETVTASILTSFTYYLGNGTINKTLIYNNATEVFSDAFCFSPSNKTLNFYGSIDYYNAGSPQRTATYSLTTLTSTVTNQVLYLLPTASGIYTRYRTIDVAGNSVTGVFAVVTRLISGSTVTISSGYTDSSGLIAFFLNPDFSYDYTFSKDGYSTAQFSLTPNSLDTYTITMGSGLSGISNGSQISQGLVYEIQPTNNTLLNNTVYTFSLNASANQTLTFISLNITNESGYQMGYVSSNGPGYISVSVDTGNETFMYANVQISTAEESFTVSRVWLVGNFYVGSYSLFKQLSLFSEYDFNPFWRISIFVVLLLAIIMLAAKNDLVDSMESKIAVIVAFTWLFSIVGWLDVGITINVTGSAATLAQFGSKYGIAILTSAIGIPFILRRMFT